MKEKLIDFIDSIRCRWHRFSLRRVKDRLGIWFSYFKVSKNVYDFDYSSILEVERHQLLRTIKSITKYQHHVDWERDVYWMKLCVSLLDIILGKEDWWSIETPDQEMWVPSKDHEGMYELSDGYFEKSVYHFKRYVNVRNGRRFFPNIPVDWEKHPCFKIDLREAKAWELYCRIRQEHMFEWWD